MKGKILLLLIGIFSITLNATELKRDGWNLIAVCQDMNKDEINMTGISQIQSLEGKNIYTGSFADFSNLNTLVAGYGYWVKGDAGVNFNEGKSTKKLEVPLNRDGWNILGMCEDRSIENIDMSGFQQIQSLEGKNIYTGSFADFSNLNLLKSGYAYWVKGTMGISFLSKDGASIPIDFKYGAVNNQNKEVNTSLEIDGKVYSIKLVSDENISSGGQEIQKDIIVSINGQQAPAMPIINTYEGKRVVVAVYNAQGELVAVSEIMTISEAPVFIIPIIMELEEPNNPPVLTSIPDQTINEDATPLTIDLNATDEDGDSISYDANSSDVSIATVSLSGNQLTITPMPNMSGDITITATASDGELTDTKTFTVTINPVNDAPILATIPTQIMDEDAFPLTIDLNATDVDGDIVTYNATSLDPLRVTASISGNQLTITPKPDMNGDVNITVVANDGTVDSNIEEFKLIITPINDAPILQPIPSQTVDENGSEIVIELNATDVDVGDTLTYEANSSDETKMTLSLLGSRLTLTPQELNGGEVTIYARVIDSSGAEDIESFIVTLPDRGDDNGSLPPPNDTYKYGVINNQGEEINGTVEVDGVSYLVKLYADYAEVADAQKNHKGARVKVSGVDTETLSIQSSYVNHSIVAGVYLDGALVVASDPTLVDPDAPGVLISVELPQ